MPESVQLLLFNAGAQIAFSSAFGLVMLAPMQPWGMKWRRKFPRKAALAAHLDWYMLAFMQGIAAAGIAAFGVPSSNTAAWLLIAGGWLNPTPYLFRGFGINAFALAGPPRQWLAASLGAASVACILIAWALLLPAWWQGWQPG